MELFEDQSFSGIDFRQQAFVVGVYEQCQFSNCQWGNTPFNGSRFSDCIFSDCDLSNAQISDTLWQEVKFRGSKLMGLAFDQVRPLGFSIDFSGCQLDHSVFYQMDLRRCKFSECQLRGVDFTASDLRGVDLRASDLREALFSQSNLQKADLRHARGYQLDPDLNQINGAHFSMPEVVNLLRKYQLKIDA